MGLGVSQIVGVVDANMVPKGDEKIINLNTVKTLTPPAGATAALIQATTQNVRWRDSGSDPTANTGIAIITAQPPFWYTGDLTAIRFIEEAASAVLNVSYYGAP
jgi:hypothetical protein